MGYCILVCEWISEKVNKHYYFIKMSTLRLNTLVKTWVRFAKNQFLRAIEFYHYASNRKLILLIALTVFVLGICAYYEIRAIYLPWKLFKIDYGSVITDRNGKILRVYLNSNQMWKIPADDNKIPRKLAICVTQFEDRRFYIHNGIDVISLFRAALQNIIYRKKISGASTITMQVARLAKPKKRNLINKVIEICQALLIDTFLPKHRILSLYLQNAPYGSNIIGVHAACFKYFGKNLNEITWAEAATIAVLPNSPGLISIDKRRVELVAKRNKLLQQLHRKKYIDDETFELSLLEPIPYGKIKFPFIAPHFCNLVHAKYKNRNIRTTIDYNVQTLLENKLSEHIVRLNNVGIKNICAIIIETSTGKILGYAGSQNYFDRSNNGSVDGVLAPRSTGSILKPFLYALAFDECIIGETSLLKDIPTFYGAFAPFNADNNFRGMVRADEALIRSLNVPAVRLLYTYGHYDFYSFLKKAGMKTLFRSADDYGLTIILGGAEGTVFDIANMYRSLGCYGKFGNLIMVEDANSINGKQLISAGASYKVLNILRDVKRPEAEYFWQFFQDNVPIAWKTGTSYGYRDAWAAGVTPEWTLVVWVGNFTGEGNPNIYGARAAGPVFFDIFRALPKNPHKLWFTKPDSAYEDVILCAVTGFAASCDCPETVIGEKVRNEKTFVQCPYHKKIFLNKARNEQVCSYCWYANDYIEEYRAVFPAEVAHYMALNGENSYILPPHRKNCPSLTSNEFIDIIYPVSSAIIKIPRDSDGKFEKLVLRAAHSGQNAELFWYLDDKFLGTTISAKKSAASTHNFAVDIDAGVHKLTIFDNDGNKKGVRFSIEKK